METIILLSKDKKITEAYLLDFFKKQAVEPIDVTAIDFQTDKKGAKKQSIGIAEVRQFQKKVVLTPIRSKKKCVVFYASEAITIPAQNALLKTLEEPPNNTIIILIASELSFFLPTVLSRCFVVELTTPLKKEEAKDKLNITSLPSSVSKLLILAQNAGKDKESALSYLSDSIKELHGELIEQYITTQSKHPTIPTFLTEFQKTYTIIKTTNVNPRFALENLLLSL